MARIDLATTDDMPPRNADLLRALASPEDIDEDYQHLISSAERNVYRTFGHSPVVLEAFRAFASTLWNESALSTRERELVTLRVAREVDSAYVWHQHTRISLTAGITAEEIRSLGLNALDAFSEGEAALLAYTRAYVYGCVDDDVHAAAAAHYDARQLVEIGLVAGLYLLICRSMQALDVEIEEPFVGWDLANA